MAYAQRNYGDHLGNGAFTIAEAGCLLTAFANLLARFGKPIDPPTLNQYFLDKNVYLRDADGALEDLSWSSVSAYDPTLVVTNVIGGGIPDTANAIVKFHYNSVHTGQPIDHYCLVDHIDGNQVFILDSWDGLVKAPAQYEPVYHNILAYATYAKAAPVATPAPAPNPAPPATAPNLSDTYTVVCTVPGYYSSSFAAAHNNSNSTVLPRKYYVFNRFNGMVNVTTVPGQPGWWINPADNVLAAPASAAAQQTVTVSPGVTADVVTTSTPAPTIGTTVSVAAADPAPLVSTDWHTTYRAFVNKDGQRKSVKYVALANYTVKDLDTRHPDAALHTGDILLIAGTFMKDGTVWARPLDAVQDRQGNFRGWWYGIPLDGTVIEDYAKLYDTQTTVAERQMLHQSSLYDYFVMGIEYVRKLMSPLLDWLSPGKNKDQSNSQ